MSRSYKKNAIIKDRGNGMQKLAHHRTRMIVRNLLNSKLEYDELLFPTKRDIEHTNPWDICDWKMRFPFNKEYWYYRYWTNRFLKKKITAADLRKYRNK